MLNKVFQHTFYPTPGVVISRVDSGLPRKTAHCVMEVFLHSQGHCPGCRQEAHCRGKMSKMVLKTSTCSKECAGILKRFRALCSGGQKCLQAAVCVSVKCMNAWPPKCRNAGGIHVCRTWPQRVPHGSPNVTTI